MNKTARQKLAEKNIHWKETYTQNTERLKRMYSDIIGKGSYFRWEGKDADTGDEYFVIIGPAKIKEPEERWFAGCRKLPSDWAAGGKYFSEIKEAMNYANETWGIIPPSNFKFSYDTSDLKGIGEKVEKWKEQEKNMKKESMFDFPIIFKEAGGPPIKRKYEGAYWFDADQIAMGDPKFSELLEQDPNLEKARKAILMERNSRRRYIEKVYGPEYVNADFYQVFLGYKPDVAPYQVSVGPYCSRHPKRFTEAFDKFGAYTKVLNIDIQQQMDEKIRKMIEEYLSIYGVHLKPEDFVVQGGEKATDSVALSDEGRDKVRSSETFQKNLNYYKDKYGVKNESEAKKVQKKEVDEYLKNKEAYDIAYAEAQKSGKAFEMNIPYPPRIDLIRYRIGQQYPTRIFKDKPPKDMPLEEQILNFGFDSIQEALGFALQHLPSDFPSDKLLNVNNVTTEDLRKAREKHLAGKTEEERAQEQAEAERKEQTYSTPPEKTPSEKVQETDDFSSLGDLSSIDDLLTDIPTRDKKETVAFKKTILDLVKLASALDQENKHEDAEEIHQILRKYMGK